MAYGSPLYAYAVFNKRNPLENLIISSYPEAWVNFYRTNNIHSVVPVILAAFNRVSPFYWDKNITPIPNVESTDIFTFSENYNIDSGYTFVLHEQNQHVALLTLLIDKDINGGMGKYFVKKRGDLQMLLIFINEHMHLLRQSLMQDKRLEIISLSSRENEVFHWSSMGKTYCEIGAIVGISQRTVKFHMTNVIRKLGVNNARQAIRLGVELQLIKPW